MGTPGDQLLRQKTRTLCVQRFGDELAAILDRLPKSGPLFPTLIDLGATERARCSDVVRSMRAGRLTLHSYRYAWAERARTAGYPERFAQEALGTRARRSTRLCAQSRVELPALEDYERKRAEQKVIALQLQPCSHVEHAPAPAAEDNGAPSLQTSRRQQPLEERRTT